MIVVLFGQPHSGKTTLANNLRAMWSDDSPTEHNWIDGDAVRGIFHNTDFSKQGRINNLNRITDIATYLNYIQGDVVVSAVYPYWEARKYMNDLNPNDVAWVYLHYHEIRGREKYHVADFDMPTEGIGPEGYLSLNTSVSSISSCITAIDDHVKARRARRTQILLNPQGAKDGKGQP